MYKQWQISVQVVSIDKVSTIHGRPSRLYVKRMKEVLTRQGQIEPLQVYSVNGKLFPHKQEAWGNEIIVAAKELNWPTLLVLVTDKYIL